ncbi:hypothetical protein EHQ94_13330 [Leptospira meyeri]|nr:hypothetical protein EHQ94_13330 [Leptospira meyeri]TGM67902.1 hypothetical protein EHQ93_08030 [Leptospira meyeri]
MAMKQLRNLKWKFFILLSFTTTVLQLNNCKLDLNNPKDPMSKSFTETWLWEEYLRSLCNPNAKATLRLGTGTYKTYPYKLLKLKNGNFLVTAGVFEEVVWNGKTTGKNFSFTGTPGTDLNVIVFLVNGRTFQIEWLDYMGQLVSSSDKKESAPITELSNGDVVATAYIKSAEQGNPLSPKSNANSLFLVRYNASGSRVWSTYLDKTDNSIVENRFALVTDAMDNIHLFFNGRGISATPDTFGFGEFPTMEVASYASNTGVEEIGWGMISSQGQPIRQRYLPSYGRVFVLNAAYGPDHSILLFGAADDNYVGSTGHPLPSYYYQRPMVTKLSIADFSITNKTYLGSIGASFTIGVIYGIAPAQDGVYTTGINAGDFGTSFHSYQLYPSTSNFRNNIFSKFDWNGNLIWNQFLGSTTIDTLEIPTIIGYVSETNTIKSFGFSLEDGSHYTGFNIPTTGNGSNPYQRTTLNIAGDTGRYQSIHYETSFYNYPATTEPLQYTIAATEACGGRMVRLENILDLNTQLGVLELTTRPMNEEP